MSSYLRSAAVLLMALIMQVVLGVGSADAGLATTVGTPYLAFSLREAATQAEAGSPSGEARSLAGMTRIVGMVHDPSGDVVLVGRALPGQPALTLDDLVVVLRARLSLGEWPSVSIDPDQSTARTLLQKVTFGGGLAGTRVGADFLRADVFLKHYSIEDIAPVPGVSSYRQLVTKAVGQQLTRNGILVSSVRWEQVQPGATPFSELAGLEVKSEGSYQTRFWFLPLRPTFVARDGVFCIDELRVGVQREVLLAASGSGQTNESTGMAQAATSFASGATEHLRELTRAEPVLARLKGIYDLVAVAEGVRSLGSMAAFTFLLKGYRVTAVPTPTTHELIQVAGIMEATDGRRQVITLSGGINFKTEIAWLNNGDVTPLRDVVLKTRPSAQALSWRLPLDEWKMPNAQDLGLNMARNTPTTGATPGFSVAMRSVVLGPTPAPAGTPGGGYRPIHLALMAPSPLQITPEVRYVDRVSLGQVGGVSISTNVDEGVLRRDTSGRLDAMRRKVLQDRPDEKEMSWTIK